MKIQPRIISASRRTDIPAFFADWFINCLSAGFCSIANPFNPKQISTVRLDKHSVDLFVFWTRNPDPFVPAIERLLASKRKMLFLVTVTDYGTQLETRLPDLFARISAIRQLAAMIGKEKIAWRYDPIIISNKTDFDWHMKKFVQIAGLLEGSVSRCILSFLDFYRKTVSQMATLERNGWIFNQFPEEERENCAELFTVIQKTTAEMGVPVSLCCEPALQKEFPSIESKGCIDHEWINNIYGLAWEPAKDKGQRSDCLCCPSVDIGTYDTCRHGCIYCYATKPRYCPGLGI